jgi:hypothetical protein
MTIALVSQSYVEAPIQQNADERVSQALGLLSVGTNTTSRVTQVYGLLAYGPPATKSTLDSQIFGLMATSGGITNVSSAVSQAFVLAAVFEGQPVVTRSEAWSFILDGHRFYVLPLGPEGDWAYDTTTQEWCQFQTQGFDGINFTHGVMWGIRVVGGDSLYNEVLELDPNQPFDNAWREVERVVTGGIPTRGRSVVGVANFTLTAAVNYDSAEDIPITLAFSDDNGQTWSQEFDISLTDQSTQILTWNALGSFSQPGRVFRITDFAGPVRFDGADCVLTIGSGADSGQDQEGKPAP